MTYQGQQILVVINPQAGNGLATKVYGHYFKYLMQRQISFFPYHTKGEGDLQNIAQLLSSKTFHIISILGGDGTVNMVMNARGMEGKLIHVVPCGTGNDIAEQLNGKRTIYQHFKLLETQYSRPIDLWRCNDRRFVSVFGIGFDGVVCEAMEANRSKQLPRILAYWIAIFSKLFRYKEVELRVNGASTPVFMLTLANNTQVGGGFQIAPQAALDDGLLDMVLIRKASLIERVRHLLRLKRGKHLGLALVEYSKVSECELNADRAIASQIDGELVYERNYTIRFERQIQFICQDSTSSRSKGRPR